MKGESRIMEMIKEMEQTFAEREALYKERDEAYELQSKTLKEREELLEKEKTERKQSEESLRTLEEGLKKKEEDLEAREKVLLEEKASFEKNKNEAEERLRQEEERLNLLRIKLENEKFRQKTEWYRFEGRIRENNYAFKKMQEESYHVDKELVLRENNILRKMNARLREQTEELKTLMEKESDMLEELRRENQELEKEKQNLFKKLLEADNMLTDHATESLEEEDDILEEPETDPGEPDDIGNDSDRFEDFLQYFQGHFEIVDISGKEEDRKGIQIKTEEYAAKIFPTGKPCIEMNIPVEDNKQVRKEIQRINEEGGLNCRYDRKQKEAIIKVPFQEDDEPEDVANLLRCILDYETRPLKEKGGGNQ